MDPTTDFEKTTNLNGVGQIEMAEFQKQIVGGGQKANYDCSTAGQFEK